MQFYSRVKQNLSDFDTKQRENNSDDYTLFILF